MEKGHTINVLDHGFVRYIDHMGDDRRIVEAARISYKSPSKGDEQDKKLINYLWKNRHTSPFEMVKLTLNIKLPIFVMRQYVRHRMQNLNEVSARYTVLPEEFYIPTKWRKQDQKNKQGSIEEEDWNTPSTHGIPLDKHAGGWNRPDEARWVSKNEYLTEIVKDHCEASYLLYQRLLEQGVSREMARMVLPINIYTEIYACWDLKNLLHFITLREEGHAQAEIRDYGTAVKTICKEFFPWTLEAYEKYKWKLVDEPISLKA